MSFHCLWFLCAKFMKVCPLLVQPILICKSGGLAPNYLFSEESSKLNKYILIHPVSQLPSEIQKRLKGIFSDWTLSPTPRDWRTETTDCYDVQNHVFKHSAGFLAYNLEFSTGIILRCGIVIYSWETNSYLLELLIQMSQQTLGVFELANLCREILLWKRGGIEMF